MTKLLWVFAFAGVLVSPHLGCGSSETTPQGCSSEADCKTTELCVDRKCVPIVPDSGTDTAVEAGPVCSGKQGSPTAGRHCGCSTDCDSPEVCMDEANYGVPGGWCLRGCADTKTCPGNLICLQATPGAPGTENCFLPCAQNSDCPPSFMCHNLENGGALICSPFCSSDADCPSVGKCDLYTGTCASAPTHPAGKETGEPCTDDLECKSDFCINVSQFPDGYCTAFCSLEKQSCPSGAFCMPIWAGVGDEGLCLKTCTDDAECRQGYGCVGHSKYPGVKVCGPP